MLDATLHICHGSVAFEVGTRNTSDIAERQYVRIFAPHLAIVRSSLKKIFYHKSE
jgi:hypothetical protein